MFVVATISGKDDPLGCGMFPEARGARGDAGVVPKCMYSGRGSTTIAELPDALPKIYKPDFVRTNFFTFA